MLEKPIAVFKPPLTGTLLPKRENILLFCWNCMGPNLKEQGKHSKKPTEHTAKSQQNTLVFPESFPDVNFSGHSPWSTENYRKNNSPVSTSSFLNDYINIFHSILSLQKKSYTWRCKQQELWQKLFCSAPIVPYVPFCYILLLKMSTLIFQWPKWYQATERISCFHKIYLSQMTLRSFHWF